MHQMRGDAKQHTTLAARLEHQAKLALLEITDPAVDEPRGERRGAAPRSPLSTTAVRKPRSAASRAIPAPVIPPPMTRTSTGSAAIDASAAARVRCEKGVSLVDVLQLGPAAGSG